MTHHYKAIFSKFLVIIFTTSFYSLNAQRITYNNGYIKITNNSKASLEFTLRDNKSSIIRSNFVISAGNYQTIEYLDRKKAYKGVELEYYYSIRALENDIRIINQNISKREREKFWEDIFSGVLSAADQYFTGGIFSTMKNGMDFILNADSPSERERLLEELEITLTKEAVKSNMEKEEKAIFEGFVTAVRSNLSEDKVILYYEIQKAKLRNLQPLMKKEFVKVRSLGNRSLISRFSLSVASSSPNFTKNDSSLVLKSNEFYLNEKTPYNARLNYDYFINGSGGNYYMQYGAFIGMSQFPLYSFKALQFDIISPEIGLSGKAIIGKKGGIHFGGDIILNYNYIGQPASQREYLDEYTISMALEAGIYTPIFQINIGLQSFSFRKADDDSYDTLNLLTAGIEVPLNLKRAYHD